MKTRMSLLFVVIVTLLLMTGCAIKTTSSATVESVEITKQPVVGGTIIILKMVDDSGNHSTLVSLKASDDQVRIIKCARKGDKITVSFEPRAMDNVHITGIANQTLGIECK